MITKEFMIINKLGMHARAAALFVKTASKFESEIVVEKDNEKINGKSIMGLMMIAAEKGSTIQISIDGKDENNALAELERLINNKFDEEE